MVEIYHIKFLYFFLFRYGTQLSKLEFKEKVKQQMTTSSHGKSKRFNSAVYGSNCLNSQQIQSQIQQYTSDSIAALTCSNL